MERSFNITGACNPQEHYMVNLDSRLAEIKKMVDAGKYFVINRGRQHGKTTTLQALAEYIKSDYISVDMDFQFMDSSDYENPKTFVRAFARELWGRKDFRAYMSSDVQGQIKELKKIGSTFSMGDLFSVLSEWCDEAEKPVVLMIDEVDQASNNQVFLDFLAQLRGYYLNRNKKPTFRSVILAGVHDIRNIRQKIRPDSEHKHNSPWNIASPFEIDMNFSSNDIAGMLNDYENDRNTGMNIDEVSNLIYDYTSGYPVLVSNICKINDEELKSDVKWTSQGIIDAVGKIVSTKQMLFDSLTNKLEEDEELRNCVHNILINGEAFSYNPYDNSTDMALMYGFVKVDNGSVVIANRIFEIVLYNLFLTSKQMQVTPMYKEGSKDKPQFIQNGVLNMELILEKFILHFNDIYGTKPDKFKEDDGRKLFLLYLRPIINGTGNYYIEAQTRDQRRTDVIVDYLGQQYIIELKIWHGDEYNTQGEKQLSEYLDYYHINKGYLLSFNFNKNKRSGMHTLELNDRTIVEAVV
ncbi:MAG: AAA-like domain-containing protein [Ruminococcus flavefaciens]|nr:AAA-like domain-containing protein [Ruminococcus flavefaciens]